jgi:uncharacterized LabA/DUF88 family protein
MALGRVILFNMQNVFCFFDGQSLFKQAEDCFGYKKPDYDPLKLAELIVELEPNRVLKCLRFYTGIHKASINPSLHTFWNNKLSILKKIVKAKLGDNGIFIFTRELKYNDEEVFDKKTKQVKIIKKGREKGINVRLALDMVEFARKNEYDVAIIFSQDGDLEEAVKDVNDIASEQGRIIKIECAFPFSMIPIAPNTYLRGIPNTKWIKIEKGIYDLCIDQNTDKYWPQKPLFNI